MKKLICRLFGHRYHLKRVITDSISEFECKRCKCEFDFNEQTNTLMPLHPLLRDVNDRLLESNKRCKSYLRNGWTLNANINKPPTA